MASPSSRRAWIEIEPALRHAGRENCVALLAEGVDRNSRRTTPLRPTNRSSPSSRRAWIEIIYIGPSILGYIVALLAEGVDRNKVVGAGVDILVIVALLAEGVDRNICAIWRRIYHTSSPSSRRAWIEISSYPPLFTATVVALLAEGVDRNLTLPFFASLTGVALLAEGVDRNFFAISLAMPDNVALLAEGVDRNSQAVILGIQDVLSPSSRRAWIEITVI